MLWCCRGNKNRILKCHVGRQFDERDRPHGVVKVALSEMLTTCCSSSNGHHPGCGANGGTKWMLVPMVIQNGCWYQWWYKMDAGTNGGTKCRQVTMVVQNGCWLQWWYKMDAGTNGGTKCRQVTMVVQNGCWCQWWYKNGCW